jgi:hypothetical protein
MRSVRWISGITIAAAALLVLAGPAPALEQDLAWNQEEVAKVAEQFYEAVSGLVLRARMGRNVQTTLAQGNRDFLLQEDLSALQRVSAALARRLAQGHDREQTEVLFDRVENVVQRAVVNQRSAQVLENAQSDIDEARGILNQLRLYYGKPAVPPVAAPPSEEKSEEKSTE